MSEKSSWLFRKYVGWQNHGWSWSWRRSLKEKCHEERAKRKEGKSPDYSIGYCILLPLNSVPLYTSPTTSQIHNTRTAYLPSPIIIWSFVWGDLMAMKVKFSYRNRKFPLCLCLPVSSSFAMQSLLSSAMRNWKALLGLPNWQMAAIYYSQQSASEQQSFKCHCGISVVISFISWTVGAFYISDVGVG